MRSGGGKKRGRCDDRILDGVSIGLLDELNLGTRKKVSAVQSFAFSLRVINTEQED
jgi:hypothetical protein